MMERCRVKLQGEPPAVRERVRLLAGDMTSFDLGDRFALIICPFGGFHHLRTVEQQPRLPRAVPGSPAAARPAHPRPREPDPAPPAYLRDRSGPPRTGPPSGSTRPPDADPFRDEHHRLPARAAVQRVHNDLRGRRVDGTTRHVTETFPLRYVFRYELEHLLARAGFSLVALHGDYDGSPFGEESVGLIAVFEPSGA